MQHRIQRDVQVPGSQAVHGFQDVLRGDDQRVVPLQLGQLARQVRRDGGRAEVEALEHEWHDIAPRIECGLDLAA